MILDKLLQKLENDNKIDFSAYGYAEPGYEMHKRAEAILFANWNDVDKRIQDVLERRYELEWSDEWAQCSHCYKAVRTSPSSYGWTAHWLDIGDELICLTCMAENEPWQEEYLETVVNKATKHCKLSDEQLTALGWELANDKEYETGFHAHMTDDPKIILPKVMAASPSYDYVFASLKPSQFYVTYKLWRRPKPCSWCGERADIGYNCKENEDE